MFILMSDTLEVRMRNVLSWLHSDKIKCCKTIPPCCDWKSTVPPFIWLAGICSRWTCNLMWQIKSKLHKSNLGFIQPRLNKTVLVLHHKVPGNAQILINIVVWKQYKKFSPNFHALKHMCQIKALGPGAASGWIQSGPPKEFYDSMPQNKQI